MGGRRQVLIIVGAMALGAIVAAGLALDGGLPRLATAVMRQPSERLWVPKIRAIDESLTAGDVNAAIRAWPEAYNAALRSRRWDALLAVGDVRVRIDHVAGSGKADLARAREAYLAALWRARQEGSLDGVLQAAEAFDSLGDAAVAAQALRIAEAVAGRNPGSAVLSRLGALRQQWGAAQPTMPGASETLAVEP